MIEIKGTSLVEINSKALEELLLKLTQKDMVVKLDARPNVKSTFFKVESNTLTFYSGATISEWSTQFNQLEIIENEIDAQLFLILLATLKFVGQKNYDAKVKNFFQTKLDQEYKVITDKFVEMKKMYSDLCISNPVTIIEQSQKTKVKTAKEKITRNSEIFTSLDNVPQIEIPGDIDLMTVGEFNESIGESQ